MLSNIRHLPLHMEEDIQQQVEQLFFNQPPIQVSAVGFFNISRRLIPRVINKPTSL